MLAQQLVTNIFNKLKARKNNPPVPEQIWQKPLYFVAFGLGSGAMPIAPGTFGTLFAIPFYIMMSSLSLSWYLVLTSIFILISILICERVSRDIQLHDHPGMCIDEFAGFFVTMINTPPSFFWITLGFILFRLFDIWKPWPIRWMDENIHGGFGMILDDVAAGILAMFCLQILRLFL